MYRVLVQLGDGGFLEVAAREELGEAKQFANLLYAQWPQKYLVRDRAGTIWNISTEEALA